MRFAVCLSVLFAAATAVHAQDERVGTYELRGWLHPHAVQGTLVVTPHPEQEDWLLVSGDLKPMGEFEAEGPSTQTEWVIGAASAEQRATRRGAIGGLEGEESEEAAPVVRDGYVLTLTGDASAPFSASMSKGNRKSPLKRRTPKRALMVADDGHGEVENQQFELILDALARTYERQGYEVVKIFKGDWTQLIETLQQAEREGRRFTRLYTISHGGWDGPMLTGQIYVDGHRWADLVDAVRRGTAPHAKMYFSACRSAGSGWNDLYLHHNTSPKQWSVSLARATGRFTAGTCGKTAIYFTKQNGLATLEGRGATQGSTVVANGEGARRAGSGATPAAWRLRPWKEYDAKWQATLDEVRKRIEAKERAEDAAAAAAN